MDTKRVVVGVDGSPDSVRALKWGADYAKAQGAELLAVSVFEVPVVFGGPYALSGIPEPDKLEEEARTALSEAVREALGEGAEVTERVEQGHPARVLVNASRAAQAVLAAAQGAQLVVVGSRGRGGFVGLMLGSVSQYCVTHARCPVLVMPHEDQE